MPTWHIPSVFSSSVCTYTVKTNGTSRVDVRIYNETIGIIQLDYLNLLFEISLSTMYTTLPERAFLRFLSRQLLIFQTAAVPSFPPVFRHLVNCKRQIVHFELLLHISLARSEVAVSHATDRSYCDGWLCQWFTIEVRDACTTSWAIISYLEFVMSVFLKTAHDEICYSNVCPETT